VRAGPLLLALVCVVVLGFAPDAFAEDSYLLALTWLPTFCATGSHADLPECKLAANADAHPFALHGLWPDWDINGDGRRDAADDFCLSAADDRKAILAADGGAAKVGNWLGLPAVQLSAASETDLAAVMPGVASGLERHEWWKHGTCSGLPANDYFATAVLLTRQVERTSLAQLIQGSAGKSVERKALLAAFEQDFGAGTARALTLDCGKTEHGMALLELRIRLQRDRLAQGLNPDTLAFPEKAPRGDCPAQIELP